VLWRGSPGWFTRGAGGHSGSYGGGGRSSQTLSYGGLSWSLEFDWKAATVTILDRQLSLKDVNVVLVDEVDSAGGPVIVETRRVDLERSDPKEAIQEIVRRSPGLFEYLRCDVDLNDPVMQRFMPIICAQMRPR
jgi:hypothetical protein